MDDSLDEGESSGRQSRPSVAQVKAIVNFMTQYPELSQRKSKLSTNQGKVKKLWGELSNLVNSLDGALKTTKGWIKFWADKKRCIKLKHKQIADGKLDDELTVLEKRILDLALDDESSPPKKKKGVKQEPHYDEDDNSIADMLADMKQSNNSELPTTDTDDRQVDMLEKLVEVMDQQASAMYQMAQASLSNSKALGRLAEASHSQAMAVDRMATAFENIHSSVHDVRNSIINIDYTMKRYYTATTVQHNSRQNSNIFS